MGRHLICGGDFGAERRCFGELSKKQDGDMDNLKVGDSHRERATRLCVELMTFSTSSARHGVGGGASRRMPKGALMSGFEKPPRGRRLCPRRRSVDCAAVGNVKMWNCGSVKVWKYENGLGLRQIPPRGARGRAGACNGRDARCPSRGDMNKRWGQIEAA